VAAALDDEGWVEGEEVGAEEDALDSS